MHYLRKLLSEGKYPPGSGRVMVKMIQEADTLISSNEFPSLSFKKPLEITEGKSEISAETPWRNSIQSPRQHEGVFPS